MERLLLLSITLLCTAMTSGSIVYVNQNTGEDSAGCLQQDAALLNRSCKSLSFVALHFGTGSRGLSIVIESDLQLDTPVLFANSTSLRIEGDAERKGVLTSWNSSGVHRKCGLQFVNITNLTILNLNLSHCEFDVRFIEMNRTCSMHIHQSVNLTIAHIQTANITGTGLVLSDVQGYSKIEHSTFADSQAVLQRPVARNVFAGGMHIQLSNNETTIMEIRHCLFKNNTEIRDMYVHVEHNSLSPDLSELYGYGIGGGLDIVFMGTARGVSVSVENSTFLNNTAYVGAGLYAHFQGCATSNSLAVTNCTFRNNSGVVGAGLSIGMGKQANGVEVMNVLFFNNTANYGGGTAIFAIHHDKQEFPKERTVLDFYNCTWVQNTAYYSPALDLAPYVFDRFSQGFLPSPKFKDCNFTLNTINPRHDIRPGSDDMYVEHRSTGVIVITRFQVIFEGTNYFVRNWYTALRLTSGNVILKPATVMHFESNQGIRGGAIAMYGFSVIQGVENCQLLFINNSASKVGGAMFYEPTEQRELIKGKTCFIQYVGEKVESNQKPNLTFRFENNTAALGGTAIFASSFYACYYSLLNLISPSNFSAKEFLDKIGYFEFEDGLDNATALATEGNFFVLDKNNCSKFSTIPGKSLNISIAVWDELNHTVNIPLGLERNNLNHVGHSIMNYSYFSDNETKLFGHPGDVINLVFNTQNIRDVYYNLINVTLSDCPPGYFFNSESLQCECSADKENASYDKIIACNSTEFRAYIQREYWAGYDENDTHFTKLYTGPCTYQTCAVTSNDSIFETRHLLPSSPAELNRMMCGETRKGILCGKCDKNYSAYFHSKSHECGPEDKCYYGMLFYTLSELLPVVILFILIVHFNIPLTAGGITGLVFFSQVVMILPTDVEKILYKSGHGIVLLFKYLQAGYMLVYSIFNFDFFCIDELSFCLWHRAQVMDTLVFKYVTTSITFALIFILVCLMNSRWYMRMNRNREPKSVVHGFSALLILSFSQCASVTFKILSGSFIRSNKQAEGRLFIKVTSYGGLPYFERIHLIYAIPALFFLVFLVLLPPVLLLAYPLLLQLLALCRLSEHSLTLKLLNAVQLNRLVPLFDSFQSCYKDKLRFFAGLYFVYKISLSMSHSFISNLATFFALGEALVLTMLGIHSIAQPYKQRIYNITDSCLLLNLGVIIGLKIYSHYLATTPDPPVHYSALTVVVCTLQMILMYTPILVMLVWYVLVKRRRRRDYQKLESFSTSRGSDVGNMCIIRTTQK